MRKVIVSEYVTLVVLSCQPAKNKGIRSFDPQLDVHGFMLYNFSNGVKGMLYGR